MASGSDEDKQVAVTSEAVSMGPGQEAPPLPSPVPRCAGLGGWGAIVHSSPLAQKMDPVTPQRWALWRGMHRGEQRTSMSHPRDLGMGPPHHRPTLERMARHC